MPKLNLDTAFRIKGPSGELKELKGVGFHWIYVPPVAGADPHRYWSLLLNETSGSTASYGLGQIEFFEYEDGHDRTVEADAATSPVASDTNRLENVFDNHATERDLGDINSPYYWSTTKQAGVYIGYDFGSPVPIQAFSIQARDQNISETPSNVTLRYSDDGVTWVDMETFELGNFVEAAEIKTAGIATQVYQPKLEVTQMNAVVVTGADPTKQLVDTMRTFVVVTP